jgi:hypothetical protein
MPALAPSAKNQAHTTGLNMEVSMGRVSTTLVEFDVKRCDIDDTDNAQDKTGSFANGWTNAEMGNEEWRINLEFINHVDDPLDITNSNHVWFVRRTVKGGYVHEGYFLFTSVQDNAQANGDHVITATGRSVVRSEGGTPIYPTRAVWAATP